MPSRHACTTITLLHSQLPHSSKPDCHRLSLRRPAPSSSSPSPPSDAVYNSVIPQLGADPRDHDHAQRFLVDLASGRYDRKYHYFDVLAADWLYLDGTLNTRRTPPSQLARLLLAWERECARVHRSMGRWPTLAEQHALVLDL